MKGVLARMLFTPSRTLHCVNRELLEMLFETDVHGWRYRDVGVTGNHSESSMSKR
jgi:hypothetical protein